MTTSRQSNHWWTSIATAQLVLMGLLLNPGTTIAQESERPETLIEGDIEHGFIISPDVKLSTLDGHFSTFGGFHVGWLANHTFMIGFAAYGSGGDGPNAVDMAYGGLQLEYFFDPNKLFNYSARCLIGGGTVDARYRHPSDPAFFVAEPEGRVTLNVFQPFRIGIGVGYRLVAADSPFDLGGPTLSFSFKFGKF